MPTPTLSDDLAKEAVAARAAAGGSLAEAARALNLAESTLKHRLKRAAQRGFMGAPPKPVAPGFEIRSTSHWQTASGEWRESLTTGPEAGPDFQIPDGFALKGGTYHVGPDGRIKQHWPRVGPESGGEEVNLRIGEIIENLPIWPKVTLARRDHTAALSNLYVLSDAHIGMLAWGVETGGDWDLHIAERMLVAAFDAMIDAAPNAIHATIALLGDWMHYDGLLSVTPTSGHILDADGRPSKMVDVAIEVACHIVKRALETHPNVTLLVAEGNHDLMGTVWLRKMFRRLYRDEDRLEVIDTPLPYYAIQHGETFLGFHHGHLKGIRKPAELINVFSHEFPEMWGATRKRYIHTGDKHFANEDGSRGTIIRQHPTIASRDAWAARNGFLNLRGAISTTYHIRYGETGSNRVCPEMLE